MEEKNTILNASIYACILIPETLICEKAWILESRKHGVLYGPGRNFPRSSQEWEILMYNKQPVGEDKMEKL